MRSVMVIVSSAWFLGLWSCGGASVHNYENGSRLNIVGGRAASYHPYFVQLLAGANSPVGFCGGTLIAPRVVATAAHCIQTELANDLYVAMGIDSGVSLHLTHPVKVIGIVRHPEFAGIADHGNDLALLYLDQYKATQFRNPVEPIHLDTSGPVPETLKVIGLGSLTSLGSVETEVIQEADVQMVPQNQCDKSYEITDRQICAGDFVNGGRDSCHGDGGGPLIRMDADGNGHLVGVASYGHGCAQKNQPGIYTKISAYASWIDSQIKLLAIELDPAQPTLNLPQLVATRCLSQINGLTERVTRDDNSRETVWKVDDLNMKFVELPVPPTGAPLAVCEFKDQNLALVHVTWHRLAANERAVIAVAQAASGKYYQSTPMNLKYLADTVFCDTARGKVALYDTRDESYVSYEDRMYYFGEEISDPENDQTTWGCQIGNAAVEIFEAKSDGHLGARVTHPALGTIVRLLKTDDRIPEKMLRASISQTDAGATTLHINNIGKEDLFTWQLECFSEFTLIMKSGERLKGVHRRTGSGFNMLVDMNAHSAEAIVRANSSLDLAIEFVSSSPGGYGCFINQTFQVFDP